MADIIYRKMQNGKEFMIIKQEEKKVALSIMLSDRPGIEHTRVLLTHNPMIIQEYLDDHVSMPSSRQVFVAVFNTAMDNLMQFALSVQDIEL